MIQNSEISQLSRKEREKKSREEEILNAARILFSQKGYHDTTLEEIAHKAEFAKGTIYNYFANKDELFFGIVDSVIDAMFSIAESALSRKDLDVPSRLGLYAQEIIRYSIRHSDLFKIMMREGPRAAAKDMDVRMKQMLVKEPELRNLIAAGLSEEMSRGTIRDVDPQEAALLFEGMVRIYCMQHVKDGRPVDDATIVRASDLMISIFFDGIKNKP